MNPIPDSIRCLRHSFTSGRARGCALGSLLVVGLLAAAPLPAQPRSQVLEPGGTFRAPSAPSRTRDTYRLTVEKAGLLALDVSEPHLLWLDPPDLEVVHRRPGSLMVWVPAPRTVDIALTAAVPGAPLSSYRLRNAVVAGTSAAMEELILIEDPPNTCAAVVTSLGTAFGGTQGVVVPQTVDEWDCDVLEGENLTAGILRLESRLGTLQTSLFGSSVCGGSSLIGAGVLSGLAQVLAPVFPGPFRVAVEAASGFTGSYLLAAALLDPCQQGEQDDHHETWLCATSLVPGGPVTGTIDNNHGDDVDAFSFTLAADGEVLLSWVSAQSGWRVRITDATGRLVTGTAGAFSWQARLEKGRYFVALERPDGSSATYELTMTLAP